MRLVSSRLPWLGLPILCLLPLALVAASRPSLIEAVRRNDVAAVGALLKQGADANERGGDGATSLHWAAYLGDLPIVDALLKAGADAGASDDLGVTPLWNAASTGRGAVVERLLQAGAKPNVALASGETPLMAASRSGGVEAVKALIAHGADVNARESAHGQTALMWAAAERHPDVVADAAGCWR